MSYRAYLTLLLGIVPMNNLGIERARTPPLIALESSSERLDWAAVLGHGRWIAGAPQLDAIKIWDAVTGQVRTEVRQHHVASVRPAFTPDGKRLAFLAQDRTVRILELALDQKRDLLRELVGKNERCRFPDEDNVVLSLGLSPDGKYLATGNMDDTASLWDMATRGKTVLRGHASTVCSVSFSRDSKLLASGSRDTTVRLWEVPSGKEAHLLGGFPGEAITSVLFSGDSRFLVAGTRCFKTPGGDPYVVVRDLTTGNERARLRGCEWPALSDDGRWLAAFTDERKTVKVWDLATGIQKFQRRLPAGWTAWAAAMGDDGKLVVLVQDKSGMSVLSLTIK